MSKEAMKLALEALESCGAGHITDGGNQWYDEKLIDKAITALKEALAQPEQTEVQQLIALVRAQQITIDKLEAALAQPTPVQEPVAWMDVNEKGAIYDLRYWSEPDNRHEIALYTISPQRTWVGLNWDDLPEIYVGDTAFLHGAKWAEAKLKDKNTP